MAKEKPLMAWMNTFEKELKKRGGSYKTVDPVEALKLYYKNVDPKKAASQLKESRSEFDVDASPMIRKYIEQGKGIVASANSTLGGNSKFVVIKRPTAMGRAGQDQFMMATISDPKRGRIKMFAYHGTHPSKDGAMKMGKSRRLAESVELKEKRDMTKVIGKKVSKWSKDAKDMLASAINMSAGEVPGMDAPLATAANVGKFNDGVLTTALTFLRKNSSKLTSGGKKYAKEVIKTLGESVELDLDESIVSDKMYRASHGKKPNPNETGGWYFGFSTHSDDIVYQSPNKMKYKDAKKEAEKVAKEKGHKKVYVMASYDPELNEMKLTPKKMAFSLGRKAHMSGKRREPIKDNRLKALLKTVDDSKTRNAMNKEWLRGWDQENLKESRDDFSYLDRKAASDDRMFAAKKFMDALKRAKIKAEYVRSSGTMRVAKKDLGKAQSIGKKLNVSRDGVSINVMKENVQNEQTFKKKAVGDARAASQQKIDMIKRKIDALKDKQSGHSQLDDIKKKQAANAAHKADMEKKLAASKARIAALRQQLKDDRDYKKEYENYHSKPEQRANRSKRVLARREMIKNGRATKGDGKDVDHKDGNPQNNSPSNLRMMSVNANRGRNNNKNEEHGAGEEGTNSLLNKYRSETPGQ